MLKAEILGLLVFTVLALAAFDDGVDLLVMVVLLVSLLGALYYAMFGGDRGGR